MNKSRELAIIGDRRTCALIDKQGNIVWYCPQRFDKPSLFAYLIDSEESGIWKLEAKNLEFEKRSYLEQSGLLRTSLTCEKGNLQIEDWMPLDARFYGICRKLSASPVPYTMQISPRPDYARRSPVLEEKEIGHVSLEFDFHLYSSHPLNVKGENISCEIPAGEEAWFILAENMLDEPGEKLEEVRELTLRSWRELNSHNNYTGTFREEVQNALRILRLLTSSDNGGIIAAATTSLPQIIGGERNHDYRYVWLRDAAMIVSALVRAGSDGEEERKFLSFICTAMHRIPEPTVPMITLDGQPAGPAQVLQHFRGYKGSRPVHYGNKTNNQLQLDSIGNVLIAAKVIYNRYHTREHWETIQRLANFLVDHWNEPDHGIWEDIPENHYTTSKVIASVSLKYIVEHTDDPSEKECWKSTAAQIRQYVEKNCRTPSGAYAVYPGSENVDVSAMLFPVWGYTAADSKSMLATIDVLEREYCRNDLYRRYREEYDSRKEGAFLAGSLWVAQYWVMRKNWKKVEVILTAVLRLMNDVGILPEQVDPETGEWLGNIPQTFVLASLIGTIIDYNHVKYEKETE